MPAKLTLHPPGRPARIAVLPDGRDVTLGRDDDNTLVLDHPRVSRRHAEMRWTAEGWRLVDVGSKNGSSVNGQAAEGQLLRGGDWISVGGIMGRFDVLSQAEARGLEEAQLERRRGAAERRRRLSGDLRPYDLLTSLLGSAIDLVGAERAFLVVVEASGRPRVEVARGFSPSVGDGTFAGSLGALERVFETGAPVVVANAQVDPALRGRPSVAGQGLGTVACVPLMHARRIVGALYLDSRRPGSEFTELDLEMLEALAEHAGVLLAGIQLDERIRALLRENGEAPREVVGALDETLLRLSRPSAATDAGFGDHGAS